MTNQIMNSRTNKKKYIDEQYLNNFSHEYTKRKKQEVNNLLYVGGTEKRNWQQHARNKRGWPK